MVVLVLCGGVVLKWRNADPSTSIEARSALLSPLRMTSTWSERWGGRRGLWRSWQPAGSSTASFLFILFTLRTGFRLFFRYAQGSLRMTIVGEGLKWGFEIWCGWVAGERVF